MKKEAILEGLLFLSGSEGIKIDDMLAILDIDLEEGRELIQKLYETYQSDERGIQLEYLAGHLKLTTKQEHKEYYERLVEVEKNVELTPPALEVLAIIAYNEPVTRVKVDEIRGVGSHHIIRKLLNMNLICECGRADTPGRPHLYKTTDDFLDHFGLAKITDLPPLEEIEVESLEEKDLFDSKYVEE